MRVLDSIQTTIMTARAIAKIASDLPSTATIAKIQSNFTKVQGLLYEEHGLYDPKGILEQLTPMVDSWFKNNNIGELTQPRNLRRICYFLDDTALIKPSLLETGYYVRQLIAAMEQDWRDSYLAPLIMVILRHFLDTGWTGEAINAISTMVYKHLTSYNGTRIIPSMAKLFSNAIFIKHDPEEIARQIKDIQADWFMACDSANIVPQVQGTPFFGMALVEYARIMKAPESLLEDKKFERIKILGETDIPKSVLAVLIDRCGSSSELIPTLISKSFATIGDPMMEPNWRCAGIAFKGYNDLLESSRSTVASWINHKVLEFFFEKAEMDGGRKAFWSKYASKMSMIRIAMHTGWSFNLSFAGNKDVEAWIRNRLINIRVDTKDIGLIMEYRDWAIIEIGTHGNACYIYERNNPIIQKLQKSIAYLSSLKHTYLPTLNVFNYKGEGRIIHNSGWESTIRHILRNKMGLML